MGEKQTEHYEFKLWGQQEAVSREEVNGNTALIDSALFQLSEELGGKIVLGGYLGDGAESRHIELGFRPLAVYTARDDGAAGTFNNVWGGLFGESFPLAGANHYACVDDSGFTVQMLSSYSVTNQISQRYVYLAIR